MTLLAVLAPSRLNALPAHPKLGETLIYQFNGLVVVFIALGLIWVMMEVLGAVFRSVAARKAARALAVPAVTKPAVALAPSVPGGQHAGSSDPSIYVVVAAAVYTALGTGHRIVDVKPVTDAHDWSREGRRDHFHSHRVR